MKFLLRGILLMNDNRGQSLVTFVLILPVILLMGLALYDIGNMVLLKSKLTNISYIVLDYGITNIDDDSVIDNMRALALKNDSKLDDIVINKEDDKVYVTLYDSVNTKISFSNIFKIKVSYVGYMKDDRKVIERNN